MCGIVRRRNLSAPGNLCGRVGILQKFGFVVEQVQRVSIQLAAQNAFKSGLAGRFQSAGIISCGKGIVCRHAVVCRIKRQMQRVVLETVEGKDMVIADLCLLPEAADKACGESILGLGLLHGISALKDTGRDIPKLYCTENGKNDRRKIILTLLGKSSHGKNKSGQHEQVVNRPEKTAA